MSEALLNFGYCCGFISVWATIQLAVMGICYKFEAVTLYEDCEPKVMDYSDYEGFIEKVKANYAAVAEECFVAAIIYAVLICVCIGCIKVANRKLERQAKAKADDEAFCTPKDIY